MSASKETEQKIQQLQLMEQSMQQFLVQKQGFQTRLAEIESALAELKNSETAFKIVGNIMVSSKKQDIEKDLNEQKEKAELRIKMLEKQEDKIKERAEKLQKEVLDEMKGKD